MMMVVGESYEDAGYKNPHPYGKSEANLCVN